MGHVQGRFCAVLPDLLALQEGQQGPQMGQLQAGQGLGGREAVAGRIGNDQVHGADCRRPHVFLGHWLSAGSRPPLRRSRLGRI